MILTDEMPMDTRRRNHKWAISARSAEFITMSVDAAISEATNRPCQATFDQWVLLLPALPHVATIRETLGCTRQTAARRRFAFKRRHPEFRDAERPRTPYEAFEAWAVERGEVPNTVEICRQFGCPRKRAYRWRESIARRRPEIPRQAPPLRAAIVQLLRVARSPRTCAEITRRLRSSSNKVSSALLSLNRAGVVETIQVNGRFGHQLAPSSRSLSDRLLRILCEGPGTSYELAAELKVNHRSCSATLGVLWRREKLDRTPSRRERNTKAPLAYLYGLPGDVVNPIVRNRKHSGS